MFEEGLQIAKWKMQQRGLSPVTQGRGLLVYSLGQSPLNPRGRPGGVASNSRACTAPAPAAGV